MWHDYWMVAAVAAVAAVTWLVLSCVTGAVTFAVLAVREPGKVGNAFGELRRVLMGK